MQATKSQIKALEKIIRFASIVTVDGKARIKAELNEFGDLSLSFDNMETKDLFADSTWFSCVVGRKGVNYTMRQLQTKTYEQPLLNIRRELRL